jgi:hypothetical protein
LLVNEDCDPADCSKPSLAEKQSPRHRSTGPLPGAVAMPLQHRLSNSFSDRERRSEQLTQQSDDAFLTTKQIRNFYAGSTIAVPPGFS